MTPAASGPVRRHLPDGGTRLLGIVGDPIAHSLSPSIQTAVLRRLERNLIYLPVPVSAARLSDFIRLAPELGFVGLNVTTPFKEEAARLVRPLDVETQETGMANTICFRPGGAVCCGTDGAGILSWMARAGLEGEPFGVLGFGATARSLVYRALGEGRRIEMIVTRRPREVGRTLSSWGTGKAVEVAGWDALASRRAPPSVRLWISTLPDGGGGLPERFWRRLPPGTAVLDMNYGPGRAGVAAAARERGFAAADGMGPLCHQAALSLSLWLEVEVPPDLFYRALGRSARSLRPTV